MQPMRSKTVPMIKIDGSKIHVKPSTGKASHADAILTALAKALREAVEAEPEATLTDARVAVSRLRRTVRQAT